MGLLRKEGWSVHPHLSPLSAPPRHVSGELRASLYLMSQPRGPPQWLLFLHSLLVLAQPAATPGVVADGTGRPEHGPLGPGPQPGSRSPRTLEASVTLSGIRLC